MSNNNFGRPPPSIEGMVSVKVDNISYRTTLEDLRRAFERCGDVGDIYIPRDRYTRESCGFAFVRFYDKRDAEDAVESMDGRLLDGRELRVQMARYGRPTSPKPHRNNRGGGGGGGGGGNRRYKNTNSQNYDRRRSKSRSRSRSRDRYRKRTHSRSRSRS